jgi:hypothetical protein
MVEIGNAVVVAVTVDVTEAVTVVMYVTNRPSLSEPWKKIRHTNEKNPHSISEDFPETPFPPEILILK